MNTTRATAEAVEAARYRDSGRAAERNRRWAENNPHSLRASQIQSNERRRGSDAKREYMARYQEMNREGGTAYSTT